MTVAWTDIRGVVHRINYCGPDSPSIGGFFIRTACRDGWNVVSEPNGTRDPTCMACIAAQSPAEPDEDF